MNFKIVAICEVKRWDSYCNEWDETSLFGIGWEEARFYVSIFWHKFGGI